MSENYFVVSCCGRDISVIKYSKEGLLTWLKDVTDEADPITAITNLDESGTSVYEWGEDAVCIIRGELVAPHAVTQVTSWDIK